MSCPLPSSCAVRLKIRACAWVSGKHIVLVRWKLGTGWTALEDARISLGCRHTRAVVAACIMSAYIEVTAPCSLARSDCKLAPRSQAASRESGTRLALCSFQGTCVSATGAADRSRKHCAVSVRFARLRVSKHNHWSLVSGYNFQPYLLLRLANSATCIIR
jgi:hypothetical protein